MMKTDIDDDYDDKDDDAFTGALYEGGNWIWSELNQSLEYVVKHKSDLPPELELLTLSTKAHTETIEFRDDIDLIEQLRFRRRYQRKLKDGESDIITIQILLYIAPVNIMSDVLIKLLHQTTTERFLRSLIFYCQYYLQIADEMALRILELGKKIRTPQCEVIEEIFRTNLSDLRILVSKEYCIMTTGGDDMKRYHHMGPHKKRTSLSDRDAKQTETLIRICVQIVWLALGRRSFNQIELEINRLFKTEMYNNVEHSLHTRYITKMSYEEKSVLLGRCVRRDKKLNTRSPLVNAVFCDREIDYRLLGLGVIKCNDPAPRLKFLKLVTAGPEDLYQKNGVTVGILGLERSTFDIMLRPLPLGTDKSSKSLQNSQVAGGASKKRSSKTLDASRKSILPIKLYPDIELPPREPIYFPPSFPDEPDIIKPCSDIQRKKWQNRLYRLTAAVHASTYL